jgi:hypothetical protein
MDRLRARSSKFDRRYIAPSTMPQARLQAIAAMRMARVCPSPYCVADRSRECQDGNDAECDLARAFERIEDW